MSIGQVRPGSSPSAFPSPPPDAVDLTVDEPVPSIQALIERGGAQRPPEERAAAGGRDGALVATAPRSNGVEGGSSEAGVSPTGSATSPETDVILSQAATGTSTDRGKRLSAYDTIKFLFLPGDEFVEEFSGDSPLIAPGRNYPRGSRRATDVPVIVEQMKQDPAWRDAYGFVIRDLFHQDKLDVSAFTDSGLQLDPTFDDLRFLLRSANDAKLTTAVFDEAYDTAKGVGLASTSTVIDGLFVIKDLGPEVGVDLDKRLILRLFSKPDERKTFLDTLTNAVVNPDGELVIIQTASDDDTLKLKAAFPGKVAELARLALNMDQQSAVPRDVTESVVQALVTANANPRGLADPNILKPIAQYFLNNAEDMVKEAVNQTPEFAPTGPHHEIRQLAGQAIFENEADDELFLPELISQVMLNTSLPSATRKAMIDELDMQMTSFMDTVRDRSLPFDVRANAAKLAGALSGSIEVGFKDAADSAKTRFTKSPEGGALREAVEWLYSQIPGEAKDVSPVSEGDFLAKVLDLENPELQQINDAIDLIKKAVTIEAGSYFPGPYQTGADPATDRERNLLQNEFREGQRLVREGHAQAKAEAPGAISVALADGGQVLLASAAPVALQGLIAPLPEGGDVPEPTGTALTGAAARFAEVEAAILRDREGATPKQAASAAADAYRIAALDGPESGRTNEAYKAGRLPALGDGPEGRAASLIFDVVYGSLARDVDAAQIEGDLGAIARLKSAGFEFGPGGFIVEGEKGSAVAQAERKAGDVATDPDKIAPVVRALAALPPDAALELEEAVAAAALGGDLPAPASGPTDASALRASAKAQVGLLSELGGNEAAVAFLRAFDLVMGAVEAAGGDFDGTALGDLLSGSAGSLGFLMEKVGAGDAGAWSALSADLGAFAKSLDDGEREAFAESAHALTVAGSTLILAGSGGTPDDALIVSGELVSIAGEGMLAAAGKAVPGFPQGVDVPPEMAVGAGFGRLLNRYADGTDTKLDDVAGILLEKGLPTWKAFDAPDVVKGGRVAVDSDLSAASSAVSLAGSVLSEVIDGRAGEIVGAVADGASTGLSLAAGSANPAQAIVGLTRSVFDVAGVEIPPEVQTGALVAMAAAQASNPVGWVALGLQLAFGLGGTKNWTEVTDVAPDIDADADFRFDDTGQISTDLHRNFWGRVKVDDGRIQYEVNGVNPELLERATFDLEARTEASLEHAEYRDWSPTLVLNGEEIAGRIETAGGDPVSFRGKVDGRRGLVERAVFVSTDDAIRLPVDVKNHGHDDDNDGYGASFSLAEGATEGLPVQHRLKVEGTYMGLNPVTGGETFSHDVTLTPEQFAAIEAELAGTEPIALEGSDPRLRGTDGDTELMRVMDAQSWTFDSERKDPNLYQYMDMNGDGALDLVRYGIKEDRDGLHSGDKRYEVTLLGPDRAELGLPTIKTDSLQRAGEIATLAPTVLAWAAARPEVGRAGHDLTSLHFAAAQAGVLDDMKELSDLNRTLGADMAAAAALLSSGDGVGDAEWDAFAASLGTDEADMAHRAELTQALGLFDAGAYGAANPDLIEALGPNPARLAAHYVAHGNREGRAIDEAGTVRPVAPPPAMPGVIHLGDTLEPGMEMRRGEMLMSGNGRFAAVFEPDGDFKVMDLQSPEGAPLWKADDDGDWIAMQTDGNLVIYEDDGRAEFATDTHGEAADRPFAATIGDDGVLRVIDAERDAVLWSSAEDRLARAAPNAAVA